MDDKLAVKLFSKESIGKCITNNRKDLAFALLPTTLLFQEIFNEDLTKHQQIRSLSIGFAIIFLYAYEGYLQKEHKNFKQSEYNNNNFRNF